MKPETRERFLAFVSKLPPAPKGTQLTAGPIDEREDDEMNNQDVCEYIQQRYGRAFFVGQRVRVLGDSGVTRGLGTVTGATHYVEVRLDGETWSGNWHPSDVEPLEESEG